MPLIFLTGRMRAWALSAVGALCFVGSALAAQTVGDVVYVQGIASKKVGDATTFMQKGDPVAQGELIQTSQRGFAVIRLNDGTRLSLRPNTVFSVSEYREGSGDEALQLRLDKGGILAVSGAIMKRNPNAGRVIVGAASVRVHGTAFEARVCGAECAKEARGSAKVTVLPPIDTTVARISNLTGSVKVLGTQGQVRDGVKGTPLFSGETVQTQKESWAVLAFRDQSVVTVIAESAFKLEDVRIAPQSAPTDNFFVQMVKGGARALTGLIGKQRPDAVRYKTATATIGIRGTGFDGRMAPDCSSGTCLDAEYAYVWDGKIAFSIGDRSILIEKDRAGIRTPGRDRFELLDQVPDFFLNERAPRPDSERIDFENLFGTVGAGDLPAGVFVAMRDGHTELFGPAGSIDLGPGETGFLGDGWLNPVRLNRTPNFLLSEPVPWPDKFDETLIRLLDLLNPGGQAGDPICEM